MYIKELEIGNVKLGNNIILAPMAGITDKPFRKICKSYGVGLVVTEMVSAKGLYYDDKKTEQLMDIEGEQGPISVQLFGSDTEAIKVACQKVSKFADIIDINMGCPAPKVVKNGDGSKLLLNLELVGEIIRTAVENSTVPVTVKFRKGWDDNNVVAVEVAKIAQKAGAKMITIHGRTREEFYTGTVDLDIIKQVKEAVDIPVIGNGDVKTVEDAKRMFDYTKVDGIMIGRGSLGAPWIFEHLLEGLKNPDYVPRIISNEEKLEIILNHIKMECEIKPEIVAVKELRKHIAWYIKNQKDASRMREKINKIENRKELEKEIKEFFLNK